MNRWIRHQPLVQFYAPLGVPPGRLRGVTLSLDGLEALRLADAEGLEQNQAAESMGISRPTFSRLLAEARGIVAQGLVNGWAIRIEGGSYEFVGAEMPCGRGRRRCRRGAGGGMARAAQDVLISSDEAGASPENGNRPATEAVSGPPAQPVAESPRRS
jgi:predicted DNA-binding protein (UPF0251 family)